MTFWMDLKHGWRMLTRAPGFAAMAIVSLGLGIGAATAIFSVVNGVLLKPLPYHSPNQLVRIFETNSRTDEFSTSEANFLDMRARSTTLAEVAALRFDSRNLDSDGDPVQLSIGAITANLLPTLGVQPALGTNFSRDDDLPGNPHPLIILTDALWRTRFSADASAIGRVVRLDGQSYTVVGVMPPRFDFPGHIQAYVPLGASPATPRPQHVLTAIARLKPGVTLQQARADMNALAQQLGQQYPDSNRGWGIRLITFQEWIVGPSVTRTVWVLWAAVLLLLLMTCVNVANLLMARAITRQHEIVVRTALGASRARIVRQLLTEILPLSLLGCGLGIIFAACGVHSLQSLGSENIPRLDEIGVDLRVLAFAVVAALACAIVFGLAPALQTASADLQPAGTRATTGRTRRRMIDALVAAQIALALVLLVGAGLMMRSFLSLTRVNPGFRTDAMLEAKVALSPIAYKPEQMVATYQRIDAELRALPGVDAAGGISIAPEADDNAYTRFMVSGREPREDEFLMANWRSPTPGFFRAMGIPLLRGRLTSDADYNPESRVALVNHAAAERFWPGVDPIGQIVTPYAKKDLHYTVVGVVGDIRDVALATPPDATVYLSGRSWPAMTFIMHTQASPNALAPSVRARVKAVNPSIPVAITTLDRTLATSIAPARFASLMLAIFSWAALFLAMTGIFSVIAFSVAQQTREIGIRMALGAQRSRILWMVLRRGLILAGLGITAGVIGAFSCTRVLQSLLFSVAATDPLVFAGVIVLLTLVALGASLIAARRATRVDPMVALRHD